MADLSKKLEELKTKKKEESRPAGAFNKIVQSIKEESLLNCTFKGIIRKGSSFGNAVFAANETPHQKHSKDFTCQDVVEMEKTSGRHVENCSHVGYWSSKACRCK